MVLNFSSKCFACEKPIIVYCRQLFPPFCITVSDSLCWSWKLTRYLCVLAGVCKNYGSTGSRWDERNISSNMATLWVTEKPPSLNLVDRCLKKSYETLLRVSNKEKLSSTKENLWKVGILANAKTTVSIKHEIILDLGELTKLLDSLENQFWDNILTII